MSAISKYFNLSEATKSNTAEKHKLDNDPDEVNILVAIVRTAIKMDRVREFFGLPITPSSWYRNLLVNKFVGGVPNSQHAKGEAVDFGVPGLTPEQVCLALIPLMGEFEIDQLILEPSWVHISFNTYPSGQRKEPRNQFIIDSRVDKSKLKKETLEYVR